MLDKHIRPRIRRAEQSLAPQVARAEAAMRPHVNKAVLALGLVYPMAMLPQLYNVWVLGRTAGLSEITYVAGLTMALVWTLYGLLNRDRTIARLNSLWVLIHAIMIAGLVAHAA